MKKFCRIWPDKTAGIEKGMQVMNFIFISPNFPEHYWRFCKELKDNGVNVLGIGDSSYEELSDDLKASLNEYYRVSSLENYDEVYRGVAFLTFKHGRIDWIESNNEYWLERDAMLRTDFNLHTGFRNEDMHKVKFKSAMKEYYQKAGIPTARYHMIDDIEHTREFIAQVGYPVIVKPDNGVGANATYKLKNDADLERFFRELRRFSISWKSILMDVSVRMTPLSTAKANPYLNPAILR